MWILLFGEGGAVAGYCGLSRAVVVIICKMLALANGAYIDDFGAVCWAEDKELPADVWFFLRDVLGFHLHEEKWTEGQRLIFLGMQASFSPAGLQLCLSANLRWKYFSYVEHYLATGLMSGQQASELGGRLAWSCNALFGRTGRAYLVPILRRAAHPAARLKLNGRLRSALEWWHRWLSCPDGPLTRSVLASPRRGLLPPALTYTDASTDYGLGGVLLLPEEKNAFFFRSPADGRPIDFLEF